MSRTVSEIARLVRQGMETLDVAPMRDLFAADVVYEFPFGGHRVEGREAVLKTLTDGGARGREHGLEKAHVTVTETASGFVVELIAEGRNVETGQPYRFPSSIGVLTVADGEITSYRDYPNFEGATAAMGFSRSEARKVFDEFISASVENRWDDLADLYADDVTIEMPFTPDGLPRLNHGNTELRSRFEAAGKVRRLLKVDNLVVHETADPAVVVGEFELHNELLADGSTFVSTYIVVMTVRDGKIVYSRDYIDTAGASEQMAKFRASLSASSPA